ncbi:Os11g0176500 [Oryza sativa Japonica Group]|uniref:Os11g0176500 protein n=1 Tax=Oryza sativa subsp. japonica TaxID=39947 RepID=A0A0P0XZF7_ORYSJ|nr:Os11g0176500 [Oryza sativa Japonica Group]
MEAAAAAADGEVKPAKSAALPSTAMAAMAVLSLLFVAAVAYVLPRGGDEENFAAAVRRLSPLAMPAAITYLAWSLQPNENDAPPPQPTGHDDDDEPSPASIVVCVAATLSGPYLGVWALFVRSILLRGCFVAGDAMCVAAVCVGMSWLFVPVVAGIVLRQINAVLYGHWLYGIAMAGFLGYSLAVNERYQELMLIIR